MPWFVLITQPNSEKKVESRLQKMGIKAYCPTRTEYRQWSDRIKKVRIPLLPSMILVNIEAAERSIVFNAPGVLRYLFWMGKPAIVHKHEVEALEEISEKGREILAVEKIEEGDEIKINNFGTEVKEGVVQKVSGNQCWIALKNLGFIIKLNTKVSNEK
ncbi:transcriptional elongation/antitermination factor NusG-like protein [Brumimicrobium salinarum]|uniref:Transcriptional elongation/antitermination factor NusG-like protein n=1 Tax=Brumimicrobium salinarum TaxID=2058658 RepID=A0A2I0R1P8_9FLAO|nr:UpxY family transcription antiterminator [Brumimicrobium salinarum]PKR80503.1 transcriptional elongation/antitermination factor NusG-like protein [Brumimicrobium salinarum]